MQSNPLMEAFGNAKTLRNDNSSRFGKFIKVLLDKGHHITGGSITNYLLEKPRIVTQPADERNYHIFYQLLRGLPDADRTAVGLRPAPADAIDDFHYLNQSGCDSLDGVDDAEELVVTANAMDMIGMSPDEKFAVFRLLAGLLHLGNVTFTADPEEGAFVAPGPSREALTRAGTTLALDAAGFEKSLLTRRVKSPQAVYFSPMTVAQSQHARDAATKAVYGRMFDWLVQRINKTIDAPVRHMHGEQLPWLALIHLPNAHTLRRC